MSAPGAPIRLLVVDDHAVVRDGISAIVAGEADISIAGLAENGEEAVAAFADLKPDIVLMDLQMPVMDGIDAITRIRERAPGARVIVLTTYEGDVQAVRALKAGASGYLLKSSLRKEMIDAIRAVHGGRRYVLAEVAQEIAVHSADEQLTEREITVLSMVAGGNANKVIARELSLSEDTIKAHLRSIFSKLDVNDRTQAVTVALRRGIIAL
ncbi:MULTISPECIES: response regulator [Hyphomonas]|uniref:DNA-binding response regulator n=1 Tax=Hyphomonas adhaerens TaxID=81029 RepID=A0A3B9H002_9PROT|nr:MULTISPECIES: response regulator transcription factor [Hyphomonas]MBB40888.1 DNA-binding response regulator [Hyphomonas sp.]HAE27594.1 DNA-binding response regulator [Hyphomonas adhaerens]